MERIAVFNHKGGVGKSTVAVQLGHGLAKAEYEVLLVDLDSQNNCSLFLGIDEEEHDKTFFDLIDYRYPAPLSECIVSARKGLDLMANDNYDLIEKDFHRANRVDTILDEAFEGVEDLGYDFLIVDCSPSYSIINKAILYYVDSIVIPVQLEAASIDGIAKIYNFLDDLNISTDKVELIVPTMFDQRTNESKNNLAELEEIFDQADMLAEPIHRRVKISEATRHGKTIYEYDEKAQQQFYDTLERVVGIG